MGHKASDPSIAVIKGMYPKQAMMRRAKSDYLAYSRHSFSVIGSGKPIQKTRQRFGVRRNMTPNLHRSCSKFPRDHAQPFASVRVLNPKQFFRHALAKLTMQPDKVINACRLGLQILLMIDEPLNFYMGNSFPLKRPLLRIS
jgi:hypothetical protein